MSTSAHPEHMAPQDSSASIAYQAALAQGQAAGDQASFFLSNYRLGKTLGVGSFGKVKVAEHVLTGHRVAIKILNRKKIQQMDMEEKVRREIKILRLFMHPHIIRLYEVIETPSDIYVVMEYVKSGELFDYIVEKGRLMEDEARSFFQQIVSGVEYCHRNMVVHRDLKPENLLLDANKSVKIADFGLSNVMRDGHFLKTSCGSPNYAAPEVISGKLYAGPEVDVWSCGVILYALLCGSLPFDDENIPNLFKKIKGGIYNLPSHLSPGARDLIPRMLLVDPLKRITIHEIRQHSWFTLHLPRYLAVMQAETVVGIPRIDEEVLNETVRLGFDRSMLVDSIKGRNQNKATVTYYLMCDNRRKLPSNGYLRSELESQPPNLAPPGTVAAPLGIGGASSNSIANQRLQAERKWRLGMHARGHPSALMAELYRVLQSQDIAWKKTAPYNLKCRKVFKRAPRTSMSDDGEDDQMDELVSSKHSTTGGGQEGGGPGGAGGGGGTGGDSGAASGGLDGAGPGEMVMKFECQMYKSKDDEYMIDLQRLCGDPFTFMEVVSRILIDMRM